MVIDIIEKIKAEKDGLALLPEIENIAGNGYANLSPEDVERLKWLGVFLRKKTPGFFMLRVRLTGGRAIAGQLRALAQISAKLGNGILDVTTRQQIELRAIKIESVPQIFESLKTVGLTCLQTGMDNVRGINVCPLSGLTPHELLDAFPFAVDFTKMFLGNGEFTNLPRKFNVAFTGCLENCINLESQDLALSPAIKQIDGIMVKGFNVLAGGKMGSGGFRAASALDIFVPPEEAARLAAEIALIFRDHGFRNARSQCRLAFLLEAWGVTKFRAELESRWFARYGKRLLVAGEDKRQEKETDHLGVSPQQQTGQFAVGLYIPVGRMQAMQLHRLAALSETYGSGEVRFTEQQNVIIVNVAEAKLETLLREPLLAELPSFPSPLFRGLVSCVGIDYCNLAVIETKKISIEITNELDKRLVKEAKDVSMRWSGCPAGCGNHFTADIGLQGTKASVADKIVPAAHIFLGGKVGKDARAGQLILEAVPVAMLPDVLETIIRHRGLLEKVRRDVEARRRVIMLPGEMEENL
ncbi:hypothetical protein A3H38_06920 [candidate division WOR-1 bacterium RIFCSPLOWO2_02_FULL_46_20]|uniref:Ferredoxin--nitrite reductase n=2 Tax=Saganbacteria TaxID=1703751 RepID=A0A1F4R862_UNCSA|nr:MAG: hypothetical protein A3H38_06920 [candidate division WOR-1 bacterium RIFCSPLOWO2_02_FULL_46_20]OGC10127.1 MAG: hypothetical protein A3F86_02110 [candidate division WOR-1 bacterium RIFCSPLOWO2_12_FULL_45_9]